MATTALAPMAPAYAQGSASRAQNYTFAFRDADVALVAEEVLGRALGISYTVDPGVTAKVSFRVEQRLTQAGLLQALETALSANGVVLVRDGEAVLLTTREKARATGGAGAAGRGQPGQAGYRVVPAEIGSAVPSEVAKALTAMGSGDTVVMADDKAGVLMLGGTAREVDAANKAIAALGKGRAGAALSRWVELRNASASTVSAELANVVKAANLGQVEITPLDRLNGIMLFGRSEQTLDEAAQWVSRLDVASADRDAALWSYRPKNVAAESLSDTLNDLLGGGSTSPPVSRTSSTPSAFGGAGPLGQAAAASSRAAPAERAARTSAQAVGDEGELRFAVDRDSNTLLIFSPPARRPQIERLLTQLDVTPRQILIEASVLEVTLSDEFRFGVDWSYLGDSGQVRVTSSGESNGGVSPAFPGFAITYLGSNMRAAVDALGSRTNVEVVSAPKIVSLDNRTARLQIGDQVPIAIEAAQSSVTPDAPRVVSIEYRNTGIILEVTPRITGEDGVTLLIAQEVSSVARTTTSGIDSPTIQQRRFDSSLLLKSGGTVALGGLISTTNSRGDVGVPFFSQLPGIGYLFKTDGREKRRTELIVLLSARILPDAATSNATAADMSAGMREMQGRGLIPPKP